jgi:hypothetical protein
MSPAVNGGLDDDVPEVKRIKDAGVQDLNDVGTDRRRCCRGIAPA